MDPRGHIYMSDDVPAEDAARLDGYLRGRSEADAEKRLMAQEDIEKIHAAVDAEKAKLHARADLRQAVWEASQHMAPINIREFVSDVLHEIESDAP